MKPLPKGARVQSATTHVERGTYAFLEYTGRIPTAHSTGSNKNLPNLSMPKQKTKLTNPLAQFDKITDDIKAAMAGMIKPGSEYRCLHRRLPFRRLNGYLRFGFVGATVTIANDDGFPNDDVTAGEIRRANAYISNKLREVIPDCLNASYLTIRFETDGKQRIRFEYEGEF